MVRAGDSDDALAAARRLLAARDADLADADRELAETVAGAHRIAADAIGRIDAIAADIESAATDQPRDTASAAREVSRSLIARNRDVSAVIREAQEAVHTEIVALQRLSERYRTASTG